MNVSPVTEYSYQLLSEGGKEKYKNRVQGAIEAQRIKTGKEPTLETKNRLQEAILHRVALEDGALTEEDEKGKEKEVLKKFKNSAAIINAAQSGLIACKASPKRAIALPQAPEVEKKEEEEIKEEKILLEPSAPDSLSSRPLVEQISKVLSNIETERYMAGTEANEFHPILGIWKESINTLLAKLWEAQQIKNLLVILDSEIDAKPNEEYDLEYSRLLSVIWDKKARLDEYFDRYQPSKWPELKESLMKVHEKSIPKELSPECEKTLESICNQTSSKAEEETKRAQEAVEAHKRRAKVRAVNHRYSLFCHHLMSVTVEKFQKRLNEIKSYLDSDKINKFHPETKPYATPEKHILSEREDNNKEYVIDSAIQVNAKALAAKEVMDTLLQTLELMTWIKQTDYIKELKELRTILTQNIVLLRSEIKNNESQIEKAEEKLLSVAKEEKLSQLKTSDVANMEEVSETNRESLSPIYASTKKSERRECAAKTQVRLLSAIKNDTQNRMTREEGYLGIFVEISKGVERLFELFCDRVDQLEAYSKKG